MTSYSMALCANSLDSSPWQNQPLDQGFLPLPVPLHTLLGEGWEGEEGVKKANASLTTHLPPHLV